MGLGPEILPDGQTGYSLVMHHQGYKNVAVSGVTHWHFRRWLYAQFNHTATRALQVPSLQQLFSCWLSCSFLFFFFLKSGTVFFPPSSSYFQLNVIYSYEIMLHFYKTQVTANDAWGFTENINSWSPAIKHPCSFCSSSVARRQMEAVQGYD